MPTLPRAKLFLSYSRQPDAGIALAIHSALKSFRCDAYLDTVSFNAGAGKDWEKVRDDFIAQSDGLFIIVTNDIFKTPSDPNCYELRDQIRHEVDTAKKFEKPIEAIILVPSAFDRLLKGGYLSDPSKQALVLDRAYKSWALHKSTDQLRNDLWCIAVPGLRSYVDNLARETTDWARSQVPQGRPNWLPDDILAPWDEIEEKKTDDASGLYLLIAQGGEGKTVAVSRRILSRARTPGISGIQIPLNVLVEGEDALASFLGTYAADQIDELIRFWMSVWNIRPVFYVDALEHTLSPASELKAIQALKRICSVAPVIASSRPEVWNSKLRWLLGIKDRIEINGQAAKMYQSLNPNIHADAYRLLTNALFIEYFDKNRELLDDVSDLTLSAFTSKHLLGYGGPTQISSTKSRMPSSSEVYRAIASIQVQTRSFWIDTNSLREYLAQSGNSPQDLHFSLGKCKLLLWDANKQNVRLRHDILDAANCAQHLEYMKSINEESFKAWIDVLPSTTDIQVIDMLVRRRADNWLVTKDRNELERYLEMFDYLLRMLDVKGVSNELSWRATWILEGLISKDWRDLYIETILQVLQGKEIQRPSTHSVIDNCEYSSCSNPRRTEGCTSSLMSLWRVFERNGAPMEAQSIEVLKNIIRGSKLRFRGIEALAKYYDPQVIDILKWVVENAVADDPPLLAPTAQALALYPLKQTRPILQMIQNHPNASLRAKRLAEDSLSVSGVPAIISDKEFIEGFVPNDPLRRDVPSDWQLVDEYSHAVIVATKQGRDFPEEVVLAMNETLYHLHVTAAAIVATALGSVGGSLAIRGLIMSLWRRSEDPTYLTSVRNALIQLSSSSKSKEAIVRALEAIAPYLKKASRVDSLSTVIEVLHHVASDPDSPFTHDSSCAFGDLPTAENYCILRNESEFPFERKAFDISKLPSDEEIGPAIEEKLRFAFDQEDKGRIQPCLVKTDWPTGRGFHLGLTRINEEQRIELLVKTCIDPWKQISLQPGFAVVHVICLLRDDTVLAAKRPKNALYLPNCWSLSIEEQMQMADLSDGHNSIITAAWRGVYEELGYLSNSDSCLFQSFILEYSNINCGVAIGLRLDADIDLLKALRSSVKPSHAEEVDDLTSIPLNNLSAFAEIGPLHPTSLLRLELLRKHLGV